jgi:hypothetical protein
MRITVEGLDKIALQLGEQPPKLQRAVIRAMNRGVKSGRTLMTRSIALDTGLKSAAVRDELTLREANGTRAEASLSASFARLPLIKFNAKGPEPSYGKGRGVSYRLKTGEGRVENAFIATMTSGHRGVFVRRGRGRLPIQELFGPSLGRVFMKFRQDTIDRVVEMFQKNFGHELEVESNGFIKARPDEQGTPDDDDVAA